MLGFAGISHHIQNWEGGENIHTHTHTHTQSGDFITLPFS